MLRILLDLASVLFLITGKSDNNAKCQFPLFLKNVLKRDKLPNGKKTTHKKVVTHRVVEVETPRELKTEKLRQADSYIGITREIKINLKCKRIN